MFFPTPDLSKSRRRRRRRRSINDNFRSQCRSCTCIPVTPVALQLLLTHSLPVNSASGEHRLLNNPASRYHTWHLLEFLKGRPPLQGEKVWHQVFEQVRPQLGALHVLFVSREEIGVQSLLALEEQRRSSMFVVMSHSCHGGFLCKGNCRGSEIVDYFWRGPHLCVLKMLNLRILRIFHTLNAFLKKPNTNDSL